MRLSTLALIAPLAIFAACSSKSSNTITGNDTTSTRPPNPPPNAVTVTIHDNLFTPDSVNLAKGGSVTWVNGAAAAHAVVCDSASGMTCNSGSLAAADAAAGVPPGRFTLMFNTTGRFVYHDAARASMAGVVIVQ